MLIKFLKSLSKILQFVGIIIIHKYGLTKNLAIFLVSISLVNFFSFWYYNDKSDELQWQNFNSDKLLKSTIINELATFNTFSRNSLNNTLDNNLFMEEGEKETFIKQELPILTEIGSYFDLDTVNMESKNYFTAEPGNEYKRKVEVIQRWNYKLNKPAEKMTLLMKGRVIDDTNDVCSVHINSN